MTCTPFHTDDGVSGFICNRGQRARRCKCGRPADTLCDYPTASAGKTSCSRSLCDRCRTHLSDAVDGIDLCPPHSRMPRRKAARWIYRLAVQRSVEEDWGVLRAILEEQRQSPDGSFTSAQLDGLEQALAARGEIS